MKDVLGILDHLGYRELRPEDTERSAGEWRPTEEVNGRYGTTDETGCDARTHAEAEAHV